MGPFGKTVGFVVAEGQGSPRLWELYRELKACSHRYSPGGTLQGVVVDRKGNPVPHVPVQGQGPGTFAVLSDSAGRFRAGHLYQGKWTVWLNCGGLLLPRQSVTVSRDSALEISFLAPCCWTGSLARKLPVVAEDYRRFPRKDFGVVVDFGTLDRIDTFTGLLTRAGGGMGQDSTFRLALTAADLDTIYEKLIEIRFFDYPEPHPPYECSRDTLARFHVGITARAGGAARALSWSPNKMEVSEVWKRLDEAIELVWRIVNAKTRLVPLPPRGPRWKL
jgi:hypothetical protein